MILALPFLGKAYHNDEPFFLAAGKQALAQPGNPLGFDYPWYGTVMPADAINTTPPVIFYLAAGALKLGGTSEFLVRLVLLPLDILAAVSLYLLAGSLLPALVLLAGPAWVINMGHVMAEKPAMAFGLFGLYAALRGVDEKDGKWWALGLCGLALGIFSKYVAVVFLAPAAVYSWKKRPLWHIGLTLVPAALFAADPAAVQRALSVTTESVAGWWADSAHKARSFFSFVGGCLAGALLWIRPSRKQAVIAASISALLFLPAWDMADVRWADRLLGFLLSAGALCAAGKMPPHWAAWAAAGALMQIFVYWSVMTRIVLFFLPPLVFSLKARTRWAVPASVALTLALSLVDYGYAAAQKEFAALMKGRGAWHSSYMGFAHYTDGRPLSNWEDVKSGEVVAVFGINSALKRPSPPRPANLYERSVTHPIPLRLMSGWTGEGGFYSNLSGFLPFSISDEPLETLTVVELR